MSSETQFNNYALHVYTLLTILKHFISRNVQLQRWCMWVFRLSQQCSWDLRSSGTKYHVNRQLVLLLLTEVVPTPTWTETSAFGTADTLDSNSIKLCWQSHAKIYKTLDKKLWNHSTDHKVVQDASMLYTKNTVCYTSSQWLDALIIFVRDVLEIVYANTYFIDIMILEAESCDYFYIYYMLKKTRARTITLSTAMQM